MADLLAQYEEYLATEKHASQNTLSSYMRDLHQFAVYLDEFHPMPSIQATRASLPRRSRAPSRRSSRSTPTSR